jgi:large subunit ribosomal protein L17
VAKAKEVRGVVERLITFGTKGDIHAMRIAGKTITDKTLLKKLFTEIAPSFKDREGGYIRIIKLGERKGDNAPMAIIELTGRDGQEIARLRRKKKKHEDAPATKAGKTSSDASTEKSAPAKAPKAPKAKKKEKSPAETPAENMAAEEKKEEKKKKSEKE